MFRCTEALLVNLASLLSLVLIVTSLSLLYQTRGESKKSSSRYYPSGLIDPLVSHQRSKWMEGKLAVFEKEKKNIEEVCGRHPWVRGKIKQTDAFMLEGKNKIGLCRHAKVRK